MRISISENGFKCVLNSYESYWIVRDGDLLKDVEEFILELWDMSGCSNLSIVEESSGKEMGNASYKDDNCEYNWNDKNIEWIKNNIPEKSQFGSHRDCFQFWGNLLEEWGNEYVQG